MKIKYIGTKQRMSVTLPVGFGRQAQKGVLHFAPNDVHEFSDTDGNKLLELNAQNGYFVKVKDEEIEEEAQKKRGRPKKSEED